VFHNLASLPEPSLGKQAVSNVEMHDTLCLRPFRSQNVGQQADILRPTHKPTSQMRTKLPTLRKNSAALQNYKKITTKLGRD
jgi:hypothetical protein